MNQGIKTSSIQYPKRTQEEEKERDIKTILIQFQVLRVVL